MKWTFDEVIKGKSDLFWQLWIDNPWGKRDLKTSLSKKCFFIVPTKWGCNYYYRWTQPIWSPFIVPNSFKKGWQPWPWNASVCNFISLNKSQTPWDQDALPSYYVLGCRRVCEHIQDLPGYFSSRYLLWICYWTSRWERLSRFLRSQNPLRPSWRKDVVVVMFTIIHSRPFVQWFWEKTVLVNQVGWTSNISFV